MRSSILVMLGLLTVLSTQVRAQDARASIIQGVRDDVHRQIHERQRAAGPANYNSRSWHHHELQRSH